MKYVTKDEVSSMLGRARLVDPPAERRGSRTSVYQPLVEAVVQAAPRALTINVEDTAKAERIRAGVSTLISTHRNLIPEGTKFRMSNATSEDGTVTFRAWIENKAA